MIVLAQAVDDVPTGETLNLSCKPINERHGIGEDAACIETAAGHLQKNLAAIVPITPGSWRSTAWHKIRLQRIRDGPATGNEKRSGFAWSLGGIAGDDI